MLANNWAIRLLEDLYFHFGNKVDLIQEIFSCHINDIPTKNFTLFETMEIADRLGVSLENLIDRRIDWKLQKLKFSTPSFAVPEEFLLNAGSHMSTIRSVMTFIANKYSQKVADTFWQELQLTPDVLLNDDLKLNSRFLNLMFKNCVEKLAMNEEDINLMSIIVHRYSMRSSVLMLAKTCKTDADVLRVMIQNASKYELNFGYALQQVGKDTFITSTSRFELDENSAMNEAHVWFKLSTFKNITRLMGRDPIDLSAYETEYKNGFQTLKIKMSNTSSGGPEMGLVH
jgi:hypothetical protein